MTLIRGGNCQYDSSLRNIIEDYRNLEEETWEIANIDLIDEELLKKDRTKGFIHIYIPEDENPSEAVSYLSERLKAENIPNKIDLSVCKNEDWENNWKEYFKPLKIGDKLLIDRCGLTITIIPTIVPCSL